MIRDQLGNVLNSIGGFEERPTLAIATSGGADSMALLLLMHQWAKENQGNVIALTVDHNLRKESADEAKQVAGWCTARGIEHHILTWQSDGVNSSVQERARGARYRMMTDWCKAHKVGHLLTAHHRGDQAETLFFRLARGSTILGLSCIAPVSELHGVRLLRPLLSFSKKSLESYLSDEGQEWIEDASNQSMKYTRNVIRQHLQAQPNAEELEARAAALAEKFAGFRAVIERQLAEATDKTVKTCTDGSVRLHVDTFIDQPPEIGKLMLSRLTQSLAGSDYPPRSEKIENLYKLLKNKHTGRASLANLLFTLNSRDGYFVIARKHYAS